METPPVETISVDLLKEGAVLAEDVYDRSDALLLTADTVLNARHLALLRSRGVESVAIRKDEEAFRTQASATAIVTAATAAPVSKSATVTPPTLDAAAKARVERLKVMFIDHIENPWMHALFVAAVRSAAEGRPRA